ncbi:MAG: helix-turn-helix domain-containing protein [Candidatus Saccharimonadales bacterium]
MSLDEDARALLKVNPYDDVNSIRRAILSDQGPSKCGTRLVLIALVQFAGPGCVAWPSQEKIAANCGMCVRSVRTHLQLAEQEHWVTRFKQTKRGHKWAYTYYILHKPEQAAEIAACTQTITTEHAENTSMNAEYSAD